MSSPNLTFFDLAIQSNALLFGEFTLKSGRTSPYFFNAGKFSSGLAIRQLAALYAERINTEFSNTAISLYGPAYKGIPLSATIACGLNERFERDIPFVYNRKEKKDHGEGGVLVGDFANSPAVIVDDVITAGTAIDESMDILAKHNVDVIGVVVALDRQERANDCQYSAIELVEQRYGIPVHAVATMEQLISYLTDKPDFETPLNAIKAYRQQWGIHSNS